MNNGQGKPNTGFRVEQVDLIRIAMPLKKPFTTSFGTTTVRDVVIVRVEAGGVEGYGELVAMEAPVYNEETVETALIILERHLIPAVLGRSFGHPRELSRAWRGIRRNYMAKAALETACWDAWARLQGLPLARALGGDKDRIAVGVSIGIPQSRRVEDLLADIEGFLAAGYQRIKVKIEPGWDVEVARAIRRAFGDIPLMLDANSAYSLADVDHLQRLDEFGLMMIEQPLAHDDIVDHAQLQARLTTPICLDESIHSVDDARRALDLGACRIINVKVGRIGGHTAMQDLHDLCRSRGVPLWCGGMLETGVGRLHNVALTALPGFTLPGDTSGSDRYWHEDIIEPPVTVGPDGTIRVPPEAGLGHRVRTDLLERLARERRSFPAKGGAA
ncbi:MAG TPA: o-succinylbenzoate synthase [Bacillota bacterium]